MVRGNYDVIVIFKSIFSPCIKTIWGSISFYSNARVRDGVNVNEFRGYIRRVDGATRMRYEEL